MSLASEMTHSVILLFYLCILLRAHSLENAVTATEVIAAEPARVNALEAAAHQRAMSVTAALKPLPKSQPAKQVLLVMSFFVQNANITQALSDSVVECLANETSTPLSDWGLYNVSHLGASTSQAEYYAFAGMYSSVYFRANITRFVADKRLPSCVRRKYPAFPPAGAVVAGRKVTEIMPNDVKEVVGGIPAWVIGAVVGAMVLITMVSVIVATVKKTRIFDPVIFDADYVKVPTAEEIEARKRAELENELRAIAKGWQ